MATNTNYQEDCSASKLYNQSDSNGNLLDYHAICVDNSQESKIDDYSSYIKELRFIGTKLRSDEDQPSISRKPPWYNENLFKHAKTVYANHFMGINFAHLSGLLLLVRVNSIYRTLSVTGKSDSVSKLFKRYYHTVRHVKSWYEGDIFDEGSEAHKSLLIVRGMHNKTSSNLNDRKTDNNSEEASVASKETKTVHLSEYDIMITQFAFVGFIVTRANRVGLIDNFNRRDLESLLHFWRVIGYYLGASEKMNLCSYGLDEVVRLCEAITKVEYKESIVRNPLSSPPGIMSVNIVRSVKFIPMLTVYGILRYLYEILEQDTDEIECKRTWFSNLSYTLINLVMSRLLAYRPFRTFNNGLTRLSLYLVNKIEDWFSNRLESKFGQGLRA